MTHHPHARHPYAPSPYTRALTRLHAAHRALRLVADSLDQIGQAGHATEARGAMAILQTWIEGTTHDSLRERGYTDADIDRICGPLHAQPPADHRPLAAIIYAVLDEHGVPIHRDILRLASATLAGPTGTATALAHAEDCLVMDRVIERRGCLAIAGQHWPTDPASLGLPPITASRQEILAAIASACASIAAILPPLQQETP